MHNGKIQKSFGLPKTLVSLTLARVIDGSDIKLPTYMMYALCKRWFTMYCPWHHTFWTWWGSMASLPCSKMLEHQDEYLRTQLAIQTVPCGMHGKRISCCHIEAVSLVWNNGRNASFIRSAIKIQNGWSLRGNSGHETDQ